MEAMTEAHKLQFWASTFTFEDGCIEWQGARNGRGYGYMSINGKSVGTHRLAWEMAHGEIPAKLVVRHKCDNPPCVNVEHLELGTIYQNREDWYARGCLPSKPLRPAVFVPQFSRGFVGPTLNPGDFIIG